MKWTDLLGPILGSLTLSVSATAQFSISGPGSLIPANGTGGEGAVYSTVLPGFEATSTVVVPVPVSSLTSIEIDGLTHTWAGDTQATLEDPNGVQHLIWLRPGFLNTSNFGSSGDFDGGNYTFVESGGASLPTSSTTTVIPAGTYNQTFSSGGTTWVSGTNGIHNTALSSISGPAGTWGLHIYDWAAGDTGSFSSWTLNGSGGGAGSNGSEYALRGTGTGTLYNWRVETSLSVLVASGSLATGVGASADQMRDQLVSAIDNAVTDLTSAPGGWTPGGAWSPFYVDYTPGGTATAIQLILGSCNVNNATLTSPCSFNPEIASNGSPNSGIPYCFGDGTGQNCPCFAFGAPGAGCLTTSSTGMTLVGSGHAFTSNDGLSLSVSGGPPGKPGLFFQGSNVLSNPIGDGILCSNANIRHSVSILDASGSASQTGFGAYASPGQTLNYQYWFRDTGNPCGGAFNFSNGWKVTWF